MSMCRLQKFGYRGKESGNYIIREERTDTGTTKEILNTINEGNTNQFETAETSAIEPYIGAKALKNSAIAIVLSFLFIVVYIRVRFSALGGLASGVTAVIALLHDILIVLFILEFSRFL